jgi:hypothetical protein
MHLGIMDECLYTNWFYRLEFDVNNQAAYIGVKLCVEYLNT